MSNFEYPHVSVIGLGYIGLPTAAVVANSGCTVVGVDVSAQVVETINRGGVHIEEADLESLVKEMVEAGRLRATTTPEQADVFVIAVPTPFHDGPERQPDTSYVMGAVRTVAPVIKRGDLVIVESTCPVGTTEAVRDLLAEMRTDLKMPAAGTDGADIAIAYCPERVLPGKIIRELRENDRSIGGITSTCSDAAMAFYSLFVEGSCIATTARTAEMVKLVENSFRDTNIAFANELSVISDKLGLDVWEVISLANRHPRVNILQPGPGVGGHCIAVDPWFIVSSAPEEARLIRMAREVNDAKPEFVMAKARSLLDSAGPDATLACLGLAFKANIDDFRESPALKIALDLAREYANRVVIVEPHIEQLPPPFDGTGARLVDLEMALENSQAILLLVDHDAFKVIKSDSIAGKNFYDTRGVLHQP